MSIQDEEDQILALGAKYDKFGYAAQFVLAGRSLDEWLLFLKAELEFDRQRKKRQKKERRKERRSWVSQIV